MSDEKAVTLRELAPMVGYGLTSLKKMRLPLINGKIFPSDFRRIVRRRQDHAEDYYLGRIVGAGEFTAAPETIGSIPRPLPNVDKFRAPR